MHDPWDVVAAGEGVATVLLAGVAATVFTRRAVVARRIGRRVGAATIALGATGVGMLAVEQTVVALGGRSPVAAVLLGLPALVAQAMLAALGVRREARRIGGGR